MKHQGDGANQNHPQVSDRVGLGHHPGSLPLGSPRHGNHSVSGAATFQLEKINLHM